jgi:hypothetical protein
MKLRSAMIRLLAMALVASENPRAAALATAAFAQLNGTVADDCEARQWA